MEKNNKDWRDLRIVFMGTPEFAVASLEKLISEGCNVVCVITAPDKPGGRGMQLQQSAVKKYAMENGLHVLQPEKLKNQDFLEHLKELNADIHVVVAFRMLPEAVWNMPQLGTINVHGSLLPAYKGAAPINWAIINGEKYTGVTTFRLKHEIDTGNILLSEKIAIGEDETSGELLDKMKIAGAGLLLTTIKKIAEGTIKEVVQQTIESDHRLAPKIFTDTCRINWNMQVEKIYNLIRGLSPYPGAFTLLDNKTLKIFKAKKIMEAPATAIGNIESDQKSFLRFAATDGYIDVIEVQLEGKKKMEVKEFLRGYRFS